MSTAQSDRYTVRLRITGRVQGVGYRLWVQRNAHVFGLDGWVRNLRDGAVEVVVSGAVKDVMEMMALCRTGPRYAFVQDVALTEEAAAPPPGFHVLPTA